MAAATLTIRDETPGGEASEPWAMEFEGEAITARELIRERVYQEVQDHNLALGSGADFRGLVRPAGSRRGATARPIDWKAQYERAVAAFEANEVLILVDDRQAESLDEPLAVGQGSVVSFLRLTLLVGG